MTVVSTIRDSLSGPHQDDIPIVEPHFTQGDFREFNHVPSEDIRKLITSSPNKSCLLDPLPVWLLKENINIFLPCISSIVNSSLNTGVFPSSLKEAVIVPLIKKPNLDRNDLSSYRPVSNVPFLSKIIEKAVLAQLKIHLDAFDLHDEYQSAYRKHHSTETALLRLRNDILQGLDGKKAALVVLLDMSSAFDLVDHLALIDRMRTVFGICGTANTWLYSFISNRFSKCKVAGELSTAQLVECGVPQGSVLGPQLFSCYIEPVSRIIRQFDIRYHMYADDITLYTFVDPKVPGMVNDALRALSNCIHQIEIWMKTNMLKLNYAKTEFISFASPRLKHHISDIKLEIPDSATLDAKPTVKILGATFDSSMKMDANVSSLCSSLHYHMSNISRIRGYITKEACEHAVRTLISTRLDYANSLLYGVRAVDMQRLQRVQNRAAKLIFKARKHDHVTPLLNELHWLPVRARIVFKVLMIVYKCFHHNSPSYLCSLMTHRNSRPGLRSSTDATLLHVPLSNSLSGDNSFLICAPKLWNSLPILIRQAPSLESFKKALKTHLFIS